MDNEYYLHRVSGQLEDTLRAATILRETISRNTPPIPAIDNAMDALDCELSILKTVINKRSK